MDRVTLRFFDAELESAYAAKQFRAAFPLHVAYTISLLCMFSFGLLVETFQVMSCYMIPPFLIILAIRIWVHGLPDTRWSKRVGEVALMLADTCIWVASAWAFNVIDVEATVLLFCLYCLAMLTYPIVLSSRAMDHTLRTLLLLVAVAATALTPVRAPTHAKLHACAKPTMLLLWSRRFSRGVSDVRARRRLDRFLS